MKVTEIVSVGCVAVGCGYRTLERPAFCGALVLVLYFQPDEFGGLVHPSGVTFLLLNLGRQKKLHGASPVLMPVAPAVPASGRYASAGGCLKFPTKDIQACAESQYKHRRRPCSDCFAAIKSTEIEAP
jgi:hypothetical protein